MLCIYFKVRYTISYRVAPMVSDIKGYVIKVICNIKG